MQVKYTDNRKIWKKNETHTLGYDYNILSHFYEMNLEWNVRIQR
jgi:hypothetical protein